MPERTTDPPSEGDRGKRPTSGARKLKADQYELKIRWERARRVLEVSSTGVQFEYDQPLKVGSRYPISLAGPGVEFSTTLEVTRCQLTVDAETGRHFRVSGKFFPYVE
jgi:hypothetical protein